MTTTQSDHDIEPSSGETVSGVSRFHRAERIFHWLNAVLFALVMATGAILYVGELSAIVGRRELVRALHVYGGLAIAVLFLAAVIPRWGLPLRADVRRLLSGGEKFNRGQQVNASFMMAAVVVFVGTGSVMRWYEPFSLNWRTGATFVHDWFALVTLLAVIGHVVFALLNPDSMRAMTGRKPFSARSRPYKGPERAENTRGGSSGGT